MEIPIVGDRGVAEDCFLRKFPDGIRLRDVKGVLVVD